MGENMCNEDFCASERILTLFQEVKSTILYRYQELSPELMAIERSVPPQLQLLIERKTEYIPKFETKTSLTEQEVMWFAEHYFNDDNGTNFFLQEAFTSPEKINLGIVFSYGLEPFKKYIATEATLNPEEQRAVEQMAPDALEFGITKIAIADMDVVLMELTGLTSADMKGYGLNSLYYLEDYHAYYSTNGASGYSEMPVMIDSGYRTDTGYIVLQYRQGQTTNIYKAVGKSCFRNTMANFCSTRTWKQRRDFRRHEKICKTKSGGANIECKESQTHLSQYMWVCDCMPNPIWICVDLPLQCVFFWF